MNKDDVIIKWLESIDKRLSKIEAQKKGFNLTKKDLGLISVIVTPVCGLVTVIINSLIK